MAMRTERNTSLVPTSPNAQSVHLPAHALLQLPNAVQERILLHQQLTRLPGRSREGRGEAKSLAAWTALAAPTLPHCAAPHLQLLQPSKHVPSPRRPPHLLLQLRVRGSHRCRRCQSPRLHLCRHRRLGRRQRCLQLRHMCLKHGLALEQLALPFLQASNSFSEARHRTGVLVLQLRCGLRAWVSGAAMLVSMVILPGNTSGAISTQRLCREAGQLTKEAARNGA